MPISSPLVAAPYDTVETALRFARVYVNDAGISLDGNLLSDDQPGTMTYVNSAWRKLQDMLAVNGVETEIAETILNNLTAVTDLDPATQAYVSFTNYWDGESTFSTPVLPQDLIQPLRLWERQYDTEQEFMPMFPANDGLPARVKSIRLVEWEWRNNKIYLVGATQANDIRIRYTCYLVDLADADTALPIMRCAHVLGYYIAEEFATARGSVQAPIFAAKGDAAVLRMISVTVRKQQRGQHRRIPYSRRGNSGW